MERIIRKFLACVLSAVSLLILPLAPAHAGLVLMSSPDRVLSMQGDEGYPESRFGQQPAPLASGVNSTFAARDRDGEDDGDDEREASRRPAGIGSGSRLAAQNPPIASGGFIETSSPLVPSAAKGVQEVALIAGDLGFFPKTVFVVRDIPVRLFVTGASKNTLCIMMDSFQLRKQIRSQKIEEITFTPSTPGQYRFYCPVNGMEGTMVVKELSASAR